MNTDNYQKQREYSHKNTGNFSHCMNLTLRGGLTVGKAVDDVMLDNVDDDVARTALLVVARMLETSISELKKTDFGDKTFKDMENGENIHPTLLFVINWAKEHACWDALSQIKVRDMISRCMENIQNRARQTAARAGQKEDIGEER